MTESFCTCSPDAAATAAATAATTATAVCGSSSAVAAGSTISVWPPPPVPPPPPLTGSANSELLQRSHARTALRGDPASGDAGSSTVCPVQLEQKTSPQHRQWCRRVKSPKAAPHAWQAGRSSSGTQPGPPRSFAAAGIVVAPGGAASSAGGVALPISRWKTRATSADASANGSCQRPARQPASHRWHLSRAAPPRMGWGGRETLWNSGPAGLAAALRSLIRCGLTVRARRTGGGYGGSGGGGGQKAGWGCPRTHRSDRALLAAWWWAHERTWPGVSGLPSPSSTSRHRSKRQRRRMLHRLARRPISRKSPPMAA